MKEYIYVSKGTPVVDVDNAISMPRERIVRCRNCRHYREHKFFKPTLGMSLGTDISDVCMFFSSGVKVAPDGFCAWGEPREGAGE